jgi:hypothetical protein
MKTPPLPLPAEPPRLDQRGLQPEHLDPVPSGVPRRVDRRSWAQLYAEEWWSRTAQPHGKREVTAMARSLADIHAFAYSHLAMHRGFLHLPNLHVVPLLVSFGIWEAAGDRTDQLRFLTRADDPTLMQPPVVEDCPTSRNSPARSPGSLSRTTRHDTRSAAMVSSTRKRRMPRVPGAGLGRVLRSRRAQVHPAGPAGTRHRVRRGHPGPVRPGRQPDRPARRPDHQRTAR